jgi:hypothetical protein
LHDQTLFHALILQTPPGRVQPQMKLFMTRLPTSNLPTSNPSSFLPVNRKVVNSDLLSPSCLTSSRSLLLAFCYLLSNMTWPNKSLQRTAGLLFSQFVAQWPAAAEFLRSAHHMSLSNCPPAGSGGMNSYAP